LSIDANGIVTAANTQVVRTASPTNYAKSINRIKYNPANCDNATATVVVLNPIDAVNDGPTIASATTPVTVQNVISNDTLNGSFVTATNSDVTPITTGPFSVDVDGNLIVAATQLLNLYNNIPIV
jgi:hypothetical protein